MLIVIQCIWPLTPSYLPDEAVFRKAPPGHRGPRGAAGSPRRSAHRVPDWSLSAPSPGQHPHPPDCLPSLNTPWWRRRGCSSWIRTQPRVGHAGQEGWNYITHKSPHLTDLKWRRWPSASTRVNYRELIQTGSYQDHSNNLSVMYCMGTGHWWPDSDHPFLTKHFKNGQLHFRITSFQTCFIFRLSQTSVPLLTCSIS